MRFILPFILLLPVIEIVLLIKVGQHVGVLATLALLFGMGVLGSWMLRLQGISTLWKINERLAKGELPAEEVLGGVVMAIGAVLLILPGFFSDFLALFCFFPLTRKLIISRWLARATIMSSANMQGGFYQSSSSADQPLEGEYYRDDNPRIDK